MGKSPRCPNCDSELDSPNDVCENCEAEASATIAAENDVTVVDERGDTDPLAAELADALAPDLVLLKKLGEGGMGSVYLARDPTLKRLVAVKVLAPYLAHDGQARERFRREARAAASVSHPNIVKIYQVGELSGVGTDYFVMEYIEGLAARNQFRAGKPVPEAVVRRIVGEIAAGLAAAHARGLVHRDVKPSNVMIEADTGRAVVLDFGIAAAMSGDVMPGQGELTKKGDVLGTPAYLSPEQAKGVELTAASDIYNLGLIAFELLSGRKPFQTATTFDLVASHIKDKAPKMRSIRPGVSVALADLIDAALEKNPEDRPSADAFVRTAAPAARTRIEWPPPGLGSLRGLGRGLLRWVGAMVGGGLGLLAVMVLQPTAGSSLWYMPESSPLWRPLTQMYLAFSPTESDPGAYAASPVWIAMLLAVLLIMGVATLAALIRAAELAYRVKKGRELGYSWTTLLDVAIDPSEHTEALLNLTGPFVLVTESKQAGFIMRRRMTALGWLLAAFASAVALLLWSGGWAGGEATEGRSVASLGRLAMIQVPAIVFALMALASGAGEAWLGRRHGRRVTGQGPLAGELARAWNESIGRETESVEVSGRKRLPFLAVPTAIIVLGSFLIPTAYIGFVASVNGMSVVQNRDNALRWLRDVESGALPVVAWPVIDSTVRAAALPRSQWRRIDAQTIPRLTTLALVDAAFAGGAEDESDVMEFIAERGGWLADTAAVSNVISVYGRAPGSWSARTALFADDSTTDGVEEWDYAAWMSAARGRMLEDPFGWDRVGTAGAEEILAAEVEAGAARTELFRRIAHVRRLRTLWFFADPSIDGEESDLYAVTAWDMLLRNEVALVLAVARGEIDSAIVRARENVSFAHHFLIQPGRLSSIVGEPMVRRAAAGLVRLGLATDREDIAAEGQAIGESLSGNWLGVSNGDGGGAWRDVGFLLMLDPVSPPGLEAIGRRSLPPSTRWDLIANLDRASCRNMAEIVQGVSANRMALLDSAAVLARDIPRTDELVAALRVRIERRSGLLSRMKCE